MLRNELGNASFATRIAKLHAAEAISAHRAGAEVAQAQSIARSLPLMAGQRAWRIFNVHAHANRRAPPGGDPGRS
ncbi:MAG: hypothetical protein ACJ8FC_12340, partial [Sphingomicrobium sp.]